MKKCNHLWHPEHDVVRERRGSQRSGRRDAWHRGASSSYYHFDAVAHLARRDVESASLVERWRRCDGGQGCLCKSQL